MGEGSASNAPGIFNGLGPKNEVPQSLVLSIPQFVLVACLTSHTTPPHRPSTTLRFVYSALLASEIP